MRIVRRAPLLIVLAAIAVAACGQRALAAASVSVSVSSGSPVVFVTYDMTNAAFPANTGTMTASLTVTTTAGGGGGNVTISAPPNNVGSNGSTLNVGLISATCTRGTAGSWFVPSGPVTMVPGGTSAACGTIAANENGVSGTITVAFTINDRYDAPSPMDADTWEMINTFSIVATAN